MKHSFFRKLAVAFAAAILAVPAVMTPTASASSAFSLADIDRYNDTEAGRSELLAAQSSSKRTASMTTGN